MDGGRTLSDRMSGRRTHTLSDRMSGRRTHTFRQDEGKEDANSQTGEGGLTFSDRMWGKMRKRIRKSRRERKGEK